MKILIGGDFVPTESNEGLFVSGDIETLFGIKIAELFKESDLSILNLETPITNKKTPILKMGPALSAKNQTIAGLSALGVNMVNLANNHIMDQGEAGINNTIQLLSESSIGYIGAGQNINSTKPSCVIEHEGISVGFYTCCEHESSYATIYSPGANPIDIFNSFDEVRELKCRCDYLIVLFHGGRELFRYPMPFQRKVMRKFAESGADMVISQHSHCIGCQEKVGNGTVIYGQGDFLFDRGKDECFDTGLLIQIEIDKAHSKVEYIPIHKRDNCVAIATKEEAESIMADFFSRSAVLHDEIAWQSIVHTETKKAFGYFLRILHGNTIVVKLASKFFPGFLESLFYKNRERVELQNIISCESHRDVILKALEREK